MIALTPFLLSIAAIIANIFLSVTRINKALLLGLNLAFWAVILISFFAFRVQIFSSDIPFFVNEFIILGQFEFIFCVVIAFLMMIFLATLYFSDDESYFKPELIALANLASFGMIGMIISSEIITTLIFIEIASISIYAMIALNSNTKSIEAAFKYFLLSSFMSAFYLLGAALIFGDTQTTKYEIISRLISPSLIATIGAMLIISMMFFKIAIFGFYRWSIDVYYGASTSITGYLAGAFKLASFGMLIKFALLYSGGWDEILAIIFSVVAIFSMFIGNFLSLKEIDVKKILIAAGIVHAGYIFINLASLNVENPLFAGVFYITIYAITTGFGFLLLNSLFGDKQVTIDSIAGLYHSSPLGALAFTIICLSYIGFPYTVGFLGKVYVFSSAFEAGNAYLAIFGIINTILSVYYYLRIIISIYFKSPNQAIIIPKCRAVWIGILSILAIAFVILEGIGISSILGYLSLIVG
ncbi:NADH-quinone oxidoreductase subunit N [Campylobacter porcelli]|uniref:NADH:quinone oxidoreductase I, membrane subunit N n=1 Tax=Campylobacter porcelli TaxID=1660073 RepID=A0A1X9SUI7_9BACT|nr:proton-conducting transporter membrane subunit [Campylobacter sp. RM6137]ARQ99906.1 NADH:quinone oxidoreductase I, membrane subunit N [Campylobacter sp. RM6137]